MSRIRFKDKNGHCFILYVQNASWGDGDYNTPETALTVPQNILVSSRCPETMTFTTPQGSFILDFNVNGRMGSCKECGQCCSHLITTCTHPVNCGLMTKGLYHCCPHLTILGPGIGKKNGTSCVIHASLMYEGYKSCVNFPQEAFEIAKYPACGFRFP